VGLKAIPGLPKMVDVSSVAAQPPCLPQISQHLAMSPSASWHESLGVLPHAPQGPHLLCCGCGAAVVYPALLWCALAQDIIRSSVDDTLLWPKRIVGSLIDGYDIR